MLEKGVHWRVGSGYRINLLDVSWVPSFHTGKPCLLQNAPVLANNSASSLINQEDCEWNCNLVRACFSQQDAEAILQIKPSHRKSPDVRYWVHSNSGIFSSRSTYYIAWNSLLNFTPPSTSHGTAPVVNKCWRLNILHGVKHFMWRLNHNLLPCIENLKNRKIDMGEICSRCGGCVETQTYVFKKCQFVRSFWLTYPLGLRVDTIVVEDLKNWVNQIHSVGDDDFIEKFAMLLWCYWNLRNKFIFERKEEDVVTTVQRALVFLHGFQTSNVACSAPTVLTSKGSCPSSDFIKTNIDAAVDENRSLSDVGAVVRDQAGSVLFSLQKRVSLKCQSDVAEAVAILEALITVQDSNFQQVIIESDSLTAINGLQSKVFGLLSFHQLLEDILSRCCSFVHVLLVLLTGNVVAHWLAENALTIDSAHLSINRAPSAIPFIDKATLFLKKKNYC
ncbi:RNA binding protein, putative [Ricinus communis]|uniref:RNA binding protein, putative n=1 Tax=Ricinus communis TaxID=3988 RepID=B9SBT5_RICCO|nr:RNA binding protein, putative [Ricinus communis]|eukprot:XP_002523454.1 uncharacterized protein LOC8282462 [Ricinus communis]